MSQQHWDRVEALFGEAITLPPAERAAFLDRACANQPALREEISSLIAAHENDTGPLDHPPSWSAEDAQPQGGELPPGTRLGPWEILHLIGRGGAGEVYAASRADGAFQQKVAIKLLRHAAMGESVRFQGEREILARLEHPGLARLLDGGVHADGRPYTVMEYADGIPLTEYCASEKLDLTQRLKLFSRVCEVVSYAHRALIVHRDLKPGNILVSADGRVKLLDFGVAKLLDTLAGSMSDHTSAPLTPDYAAPEQLTGQPITTATDIYALGVVLFELLTNQRPWRSADLPIAKAVRTLLDTTPPAVSGVARKHLDGAPVSAALLEGDLDAIVAKCLRKEPEHRYDSVTALDADIQHYLHAEPVTAREGAKLYVLGRFLRRHRWSVAGVVSVVLALAAALVVVSWQAHRIALERDIARRAATREEAVRYYLTRMFRASVAEQGTGGPTTAKAMLDRSAQRVLHEYRDDPYLAGKVVETLADLYAALEDPEGRAPLLEGFLAQAGPEADPEAVALARQKLAEAELSRGHVPRAAELLAPAMLFWDKAPRRYAAQRLEGLAIYGRLQRAQGDIDGSILTYENALKARTALSGHNHSETASLYNSLAISYSTANRLDESLEAYRKAIAIHHVLGRAEDLDALIMLANTGNLAHRLGRIAEAEKLLRDSFERQRASSGNSAAVSAAMGYYGSLLSLRRQHKEAQEVLQTAVGMAAEFAGPASPVAVANRLFLGEAQAAAGDNQNARATLQENLTLARQQLGDAHAVVLRTRLALARISMGNGDAALVDAELEDLQKTLRKQGAPGILTLAQTLVAQGDAMLARQQAKAAVPFFTEAVQLREKLLWNQSWELAEARERLGEALTATGDSAGGAALLSKAVPVLEAQLGASHPLTVRARAASKT